MNIRKVYLIPALALTVLCVCCQKDKPGDADNPWNIIYHDNYTSITLYPEDMAQKRGKPDGHAWTIDQTYSAGIFQVSPELKDMGAGSARATVTLKIPDNSAFTEQVATINIFNRNDGSLLSTRDLLKNDFSHNDVFQDFDLYFDMEAGASVEFRIVWHDRSPLTFSQVKIDIYPNKPDLPKVINKSGAGEATALRLAQQAIAGLGFNAASPDGPNQNDLVFVGKYYIAWIDQTGFYGKMNGLWLLNAADGDALDFLHKENDRPINFLGVAENGDGRWMQNYAGAEHYELPHMVKEPGDISIIGAELENWYSVNEAGKVMGNHLPHWKSAMKYRMGFSILNEPIEKTETAGQLYINFESPLTKESDGDLIKDGDLAHAHMLFADLIRYPVYVRTGYTLYGDKPYLERHYQYRNGAGNPTLTSAEIGGWALIGGIVITEYDSPYSFKTGLNKYVRVNEFNRGSLPVDTWVNVDPQQSGPPDALWHYSQSYTMSNNATFEAGNSVHVAATSTGRRVSDMGGCTCYVHRGLEIGGGVLTGSDILPLAPGALSKTDTRIFLFPQNSANLVESTINRP